MERGRCSGGADRGVIACVQTVLCRDCKALYDAVLRFKLPDGIPPPSAQAGFANSVQGRLARNLPPPMHLVLERLRYTGAKRFKWVRFDLQCPVSRDHRVRSWNDPDRCPKCGIYLQKSALPYRLWE